MSADYIRTGGAGGPTYYENESYDVPTAVDHVRLPADIGQSNWHNKDEETARFTVSVSILGYVVAPEI